MLRTALSHRAQLATGVFHEELSPARRDTEVARFREPDGPSLLVSTECGGEGRNFEFCRRLVLFDLPWKPSVVEQRIGRLDRIGRRIPVEIVYFRPPRRRSARTSCGCSRRSGVFREPLAGLEPQLAHVEGALEDDRARSGRVAHRTTRSTTLVAEAQRRAHAHPRSGVSAAASRPLPRGDGGTASWRACPPELDALNRKWWSPPASRLGFTSSTRAAGASSRSSSATERWSTACPACPAARATSASFDREEAVEDETIDFFASGHPLVEGIFAHFEDSPLGRAVRFEIEIGARTRRTGSWPSTRTGRRSTWSLAITRAAIGLTGLTSSGNGRCAHGAWRPTSTTESAPTSFDDLPLDSIPRDVRTRSPPSSSGLNGKRE